MEAPPEVKSLFDEFGDEFKFISRGCGGEYEGVYWFLSGDRIKGIPLDKAPVEIRDQYYWDEKTETYKLKSERKYDGEH